MKHDQRFSRFGFQVTLALMFLAVGAAVAKSNANEPTKREQDGESIQGRIEIEHHGVCLKVSVFLKNASEEEIVIITGRGGVPREVVPSFFSRGRSFAAANWASSPRRDMKPDLFTLAPGKETLYDAYIIPVPQGDEIEGVIHFQASEKRSFTYLVKLPLEKIPPPPKDEKAETRK